MSNQPSRSLTTLVSYPERGEGGSNHYRGNCSPKLIVDLIAHFGITDICDYMCGSNTAAAAADSMGMHCSPRRATYVSQTTRQKT